jgi:hypothetical protein
MKRSSDHRSPRTTRLLNCSPPSTRLSLTPTRLSAERRARQGGERYPLIYDSDWDEDARLAEWRAIVGETRDLPPTLAAAVSTETWVALEPLQRAPGLERLLAAALLRDRGKTGAHLACLAQGAKAVCRASAGGRATSARASSRSSTA